MAIKIPRKDQLSSTEAEQFLREARAAAQLRHPNIVPVHEVGREDGTLYIVSDIIEGLSLADLLTGQQLAIREAAELCVTIAEALHHAHEAGVIHRDLKPANIMLDGEGRPHIMDFGLARREAGEITMTIEGKLLGTPAYMPPEQARGDGHNADRRSDLYSLGVILFELLTGKKPFQGNQRMLLHQVLNEEPPSPRKLNQSIPRDLETITLKCLQKDPDRRYQSMAELATDLGHWLAGRPIAARPVSAFERTWRWIRLNTMVTSALSMVVLSLTVLGWTLIQSMRPTEESVQNERFRSQFPHIQSLEAGHPEFSDYPYRRRTRIHFDHATHYGVHFANFNRIMPSGRAPESCLVCHRFSQHSEPFAIHHFSTACGSCHRDQLLRRWDRIEFLTLPSLDRSFGQREFGEWPAANAIRATLDREFPPFMRLLLEQDEEWVEAIQQLTNASGTGDVGASHNAQIRVAWAIKRLIGELINNRQEALSRRLTSGLGTAAGDELIESLIMNGSFCDRLETASAAWFPNLNDELRQRAAGQPPALSPNSSGPPPNSGSNWIIDKGAILYTPQGHGDLVVCNILDALVRLPDSVDASANSAARSMYVALADPFTSWACMKCHTVDSVSGHTEINWFAGQPGQNDDSVVRFSHGPHVDTNKRGRKCTFCHQLEVPGEGVAGFVRSEFFTRDLQANTNPSSVATSGFVPIDRQTCVKCHAHRRQDESCLTCHDHGDATDFSSR